MNDAAFAGSLSRLSLWQQWQLGVQMLSAAVTTYTAWISGSFVSDKLSPRDIDVVFTVSAEDRATRPPSDLQIVESFIRRVNDAVTGKPVPAHGLKIDSFIVDWAPYYPLPGEEPAQGHLDYAQNRGYWDDWWSRKRTTAKGLPPQRPDALPQRGYLEVSLNAFT